MGYHRVLKLGTTVSFSISIHVQYASTVSLRGMETHGKLHESPLKAPAVEIVDLLSSDESAGDELDVNNRDDAWEDLPEDESGNDEDDILSLYEDALDAMDDDEEDDSESGGKKTTFSSFATIGSYTCQSQPT